MGIATVRFGAKDAKERNKVTMVATGVQPSLGVVSQGIMVSLPSISGCGPIYGYGPSHFLGVVLH